MMSDNVKEQHVAACCTQSAVGLGTLGRLQMSCSFTLLPCHPRWQLGIRAWLRKPEHLNLCARNLCPVLQNAKKCDLNPSTRKGDP